MSTFFDALDAFSQYPWTTQPNYQSTLSQAVLPILGQLNDLSHHLTSPIQSPNSSFFFEIEQDKTTYEKCYDEYMEIKLAVLEEILSKEKKLMTATSTPYIDSARSSPVLSPPSSGISTPSSSSSDSSFGCRTPDPGSSPTVNVCFADSDPASDKDADCAISNSYCPIRRRLFHVPPESLEPPKKRAKRKATPTAVRLSNLMRNQQPLISTCCKESTGPKRQKIDIEVICRVHGCRHFSKTKFECFKHRETHFPGRFQCPEPNCRKIFVRSSSLSRHLKRERINACGIFAGPQVQWGVGLVHFELFPPPWLAPGYLDDVSSAII